MIAPPATDSDRELLDRFLAARDEAAFRALYRAHTPYLWAFALRLAGDAAAAEELVQEGWTRAVERLAGFRGDAALRSWLGGILFNCWREGRRELRWLADESPDPPGAERAGRPDTGPARIDVERALAELPDGSRAVVLLHDLEGLTHDEIGVRLGIPAGTSKSRLFAARRALARRLRPQSGGST